MSWSYLLHDVGTQAAGGRQCHPVFGALAHSVIAQLPNKRNALLDQLLGCAPEAGALLRSTQLHVKGVRMTMMWGKTASKTCDGQHSFCHAPLPGHAGGLAAEVRQYNQGTLFRRKGRLCFCVLRNVTDDDEGAACPTSSSARWRLGQSSKPVARNFRLPVKHCKDSP